MNHGYGFFILKLTANEFFLIRVVAVENFILIGARHLSLFARADNET